MRIKIFGYKPGSKSAKALADALGVKVLKHEGSKYRPRQGDVIINWGSSRVPEAYRGVPILNPANRVAYISNKLTAFQLFKEKEVPIPDFTTDKETAKEWVAGGKIVVCRQVLNGHSGEGIVIAEKEIDIVDAPCYTAYIKKDAEYRVHVMKFQEGYEVIDAQRKIRDPNREPTNWKVRSHHNGFLFARDNLVLPEVVRTAATQALEAAGLDFGGIDIVFKQRANKAFVLEVNTAVGLENTTVTNYASAFKRRLGIV